MKPPEEQIGPIWKCGIYVRLSREDLDSNSLESQKTMLTRYIEGDAGMELIGIWEDDGYSGIHYNRPGFQSLMRAAEAKSINCILVKDLSRLGRDYIETGRLLQQVFPGQNIRFLAVNDQYDSLYSEANERDLILPVRNFVNDSYCRDISMKVRSHQDVKRRNGEYIGAFPVYGYQKSPHDHNRLEPDPETKAVVTWIYQARLNGRSARSIANYLNQHSVPSPLVYKKLQGLAYSTGFPSSEVPGWSAQAILRILGNRVYAGDLQQGKSTKINYKIEQRTYKPESEWVTVQNAHQPLIDRISYEVVQESIHHQGIFQYGFHKQKKMEFLSELAALLIKQAHFPPDISPAAKRHPSVPMCASNQYEEYLETEESRWEQLLLACYQDYKNNIINAYEYKILKNGYTKKLVQIQAALSQVPLAEIPASSTTINLQPNQIQMSNQTKDPLLWAYLFSNVTETSPCHFTVKCRFRPDTIPSIPSISRL